MLSMNAQRHQHEDLNYLVVGLGLTGFSVANYLLAHGYHCWIQDTRDIPPYLHVLEERFPQANVCKQALDRELINWADVLVVSPGLSVRQAPGL